MKRAATILFLAFSGAGSLSAQDITKLPPPASRPIDFNADIAPLFERSCIKCHGPEKPKGRFRLDNGELALKDGSSGVAIIPGDSAKSPLVHYIAGLVEDMQMPPPGKGDSLSPEEIAKVRAWIDQGAAWGKPQPLVKHQFSISPNFRFVHVDGDVRKFRETEGIREGISVGTDFSLIEQIDPKTRFTTFGRLVPEDNEFEWKLSLDRADLGFVRGGYHQFRRWYDDSGGYFNGPGPGVFDLNRDLHTDFGRLWTEIGLTLPDRPEIVLGYEYQFREGDKSTLQWGPVGLLPASFPTTDAKHVFPGFKEISERIHIVKLDLRHNWDGWFLEDNARVEFYNLETRRENVRLHTLAPSPDQFVVYREEHEQVSGANTFRVEKQVNDWLFISGGHHYSQSGADALFQQSTLNFRYSPIFGEQYVGSPIIFDSRIHAFSFAASVSPFEHLTVSAAVQNEWMRQEGIGGGDLLMGNPSIGLLTSDPVSFWANTDRNSLRENVSVRFTGIPATVLYAEARLLQEEIGRHDQQTGGAQAFVRQTDAEIDGQDFKVGFNTSPWQIVSFTSNVRRQEKETDYNHLQDISSTAYPAFIRTRDTVSDQLEAKISIRPVNWARVGVGYQLVSTEYDTVTDAIPGLTSSGQFLSGEYDANVYSAHVVLTPWRRMYLSTTFSWSDTRTWTFANGAPYIVPFEGDVYTILSTATYSVTTNLDLHASCLYSTTNYRQNNTAGLAAGIDFDRSGFEVGFTRRFKKGLTTNLRYGYYDYDEGGRGAFNNYSAHAIFATLTMVWPD